MLAAAILRLGALAAALALAPPALPPIGTALEQAVSAEAVLVASTRIAAPGPPFAPAHLAQDVHQQKRQQHACNGLARLDRLLTGGGRRRCRGGRSGSGVRRRRRHAATRARPAAVALVVLRK